jgi:hypothetical protein
MLPPRLNGYEESKRLRLVWLEFGGESVRAFCCVTIALRCYCDAMACCVMLHSAPHQVSMIVDY